MGNTLFDRYAEAFLELCIEDKTIDLASYRDEVLTLKSVFKYEKEFIKFLSSYNIDYDDKILVLDKVLKGFSKNTTNYVKLIVQKNRGFFLYEIFKATLNELNTYLKVEVGKVYSTTPLSEENMNKIINALSKKKNKIIELTNVVDPSIIGGIKVVLNNDIYDSSVSSKVERMKNLISKEID